MPAFSACWQSVLRCFTTVAHCCLYSGAGTASARPTAEYTGPTTDFKGYEGKGEVHITKADLGRVLLKLEQLQDEQIRQTLAPAKSTEAIQLSPEGMAEVFDRAGIVFMFAPLLHPAMRHVGRNRLCASEKRPRTAIRTAR